MTTYRGVRLCHRLQLFQYLSEEILQSTLWYQYQLLPSSGQIRVSVELTVITGLRVLGWLLNLRIGRNWGLTRSCFSDICNEELEFFSLKFRLCFKYSPFNCSTTKHKHKSNAFSLFFLILVCIRTNLKRRWVLDQQGYASGSLVLSFRFYAHCFVEIFPKQSNLGPFVNKEVSYLTTLRLVEHQENCYPVILLFQPTMYLPFPLIYCLPIIYHFFSLIFCLASFFIRLVQSCMTISVYA